MQRYMHIQTQTDAHIKNFSEVFKQTQPDSHLFVFKGKIQRKKNEGLLQST